MKYIAGIILSLIVALCILGITITASFSYALSPQRYIDIANQSDMIALKKSEIKYSVDSIAMANNIDPEIYEEIITDRLIKQNNKEYFENMFAYINGKSASPKSTGNASDEFFNQAKSVTSKYLKKEFAKGEYDGTEKGLNEYITQLKNGFYTSAEPVSGFRYAANLMRNYVSMRFMFLFALFGGLFVCIALICVINLKSIKAGMITCLYSLSAGGLISAILGGLLTTFMASKNSLLHTVTIKSIVEHCFVNLLVAGAVLFLATQILLALAFRFLKSGEPSKK